MHYRGHGHVRWQIAALIDLSWQLVHVAYTGY